MLDKAILFITHALKQTHRNVKAAQTSKDKHMMQVTKTGYPANLIMNA